MKLFIIVSLIFVASAARLEHLERGYLPPGQNNFGASAGGSSFPSAGAHGSFSLGSQGSQYNAPGRASNGFGAFGHSNSFASNGAESNSLGSNGGHGSNGFGSNSGHRSNGFGANNGHGSNGFGPNNGQGSGFGTSDVGFGRNGGSSAATSNQYLPPNYAASGSNGGSNSGSSIRSACSSCGSPSYGSPQRYQQPSSAFGSQRLSIPSTQYGSPQSYTSSSGFDSQQNEPAGASRQYLAPKSSNFQSSSQQPFDENTGYIY